MKRLTEILERFSKSLNRDSLTKDAVIQTVASRTKVLLKPEDITLKDGVLQIRAGASARAEINLKEEGIKRELKETHSVSISRILYV